MAKVIKISNAAVNKVIRVADGSVIKVAGTQDIKTIRVGGPKGEIGISGTNAVKALQVGVSGKPVANEITGGIAPVGFSVTQANCFARAVVAATVTATIIIRNNGTQIGTVVFTAGQVAGVVTISQPTIALGNHITFLFPSTADATLSDMDFLIRE